MVKKRMKGNRLVITILLLSLFVASIFVVLSSTTSIFKPLYVPGDNENRILAPELGETINEQIEFCNSEQECYDYLSSQGFSESDLNQVGYTIYCQNGECYFKNN